MAAAGNARGYTRLKPKFQDSDINFRRADCAYRSRCATLDQTMTSRSATRRGPLCRRAGQAPGERASFLDGACHGDPALRQRLEALLAAHEQPDDLAGRRQPKPPAHDQARSRRCARRSRGPDARPLQAAGESRRRRLRRGLCRRADRAGAAARGAQGHQAGHGHQAGRRPVRGGAAGAGDDGSSEHRQGARCGHDRRGPALTS